jgi:hypothetical protein
LFGFNVRVCVLSFGNFISKNYRAAAQASSTTEMSGPETNKNKNDCGDREKTKTTLG